MPLESIASESQAEGRKAPALPVGSVLPVCMAAGCSPGMERESGLVLGWILVSGKNSDWQAENARLRESRFKLNI